MSAAAMSTAAGCRCTFQDTQFLAGSCGATFTLFMGLVEYLVGSKDDIADACNRPGRNSIQVSADTEAPGSPLAGNKPWHRYRLNRVLSTHPRHETVPASCFYSSCSCNDNAPDIYSEGAPVRISARTLPILSDIYRGLTQSLQSRPRNEDMNTTNPLKTLSSASSTSHSSFQCHTAHISLLCANTQTTAIM